MLNVKGLVAALIVAGLLAIPLYYYREFLTQGMRPPASTRQLNDMEKNGVPDFTLPDLAGKPVRFSDFRGKVVLVNIWATWCAPCVKEFPSLKGLVEKMGGKVVVLAVSQDKERGDIDTFVKAFGAVPPGFVILWDPQRESSKIFGTSVLPETYIFNESGQLLRKVAGDTPWDDAIAIQFFNAIMGVSHPHAPGG